MQRISGRPLSGGTALGTTAVLTWSGGVAQLPARVLEEMALAAKRGAQDPIDIVLVAEDFERTASLTLPAVRVVGVIAECGNAGNASVPYPVLVDVNSAVERIADNVLVLLDADRGIALVDPDGTAVAAYQAEQDRISPRRRFFIDYAHEPARTADGRLIRVGGVAMTEEGVAAAVSAGADAIWLYLGASSLLDEQDDVQRDALVSLVRAASGKPVTVVADLERISIPALLQASLAADLTLAIPAVYEEAGLDDARAYLKETGRELTDAEVEWRPVHFGGTVTMDSGEPGEDMELGVDRLLLDLWDQWNVQDQAILKWANSWLNAAARVMARAEVLLPGEALGSIRAMVALGASGVVVSAEEVQAAKAIIRETDAASLVSEILDL